MKNEFLEKLGAKIKNARQEHGFTQDEIAKKIGVHPTYVGKIEGGKSNPSALMLFKISRALKINLYNVFEFDR